MMDRDRPSSGNRHETLGAEAPLDDCQLGPGCPALERERERDTLADLAVTAGKDNHKEAADRQDRRVTRAP